jgi:hypothetical protein
MACNHCVVILGQYSICLDMFYPSQSKGSRIKSKDMPATSSNPQQKVVFHRLLLRFLALMGSCSARIRPLLKAVG